MSSLQLERLGGFGILNEEDLKELAVAVHRVYMLMRDGEWHETAAILQAAGIDGVISHEGLRRMRELRAAGFLVEKQRREGLRSWRYRLRWDWQAVLVCPSCEAVNLRNKGCECWRCGDSIAQFMAGSQQGLPLR